MMYSCNFKVLFLSLILFFTCGNVYAADQVVTNNLDSGAGSLRQAIADVGSGETITFNLSSSNETITLLSQIAMLSSSFNGVTIDGDNTAGSGTDVTVQVTTPGTSTYRVFEIRPYSGTYTLKNMIIKGGNVTGDTGGAIKIHSGNATGNLVLDNVTISDSKANYGAGLYAWGTMGSLNVTNCTFQNNAATSASSYGGGAIFMRGLSGSITITGSIFDSNTSTRYGGAIEVFNEIFSIDNSVFSNNTSTSSGGAIYVSNTSVTGSSSIIDSTFNGNTGDGSTGNDFGGAVYYYYGTHKITNSTIFDNSSQIGGGVAFSYATLYLTNVTLANNATTGLAGGLYQGSSTTLYIKNTILANNATDDYYNGGTVIDNGYNIVEVSNGRVWAGTGDITGDQINLNLSPTLAANGTLNNTFTLALSSGSVATNAGSSVADNGLVTVPTTDQRGLSRVGATDIGAYEFSGMAPDVTIPVGTISVDGSGSTNTTSVTLILSCTDNVACSQMQFSNDNASWSTLEANAVSKSWTLTSGADAVRTVYARFTDAAGNVSAVMNDTVTLDTAVPAAPIITTPVANVVTSSAVRPTISGTAEIDATVTISDGATVLGMLTATGGNWSLEGGATLTIGEHNLTAITTDGAGNASAASTAIVYTVVTASDDATNSSGSLNLFWLFTAGWLLLFRRKVLASKGGVIL